MFVKYSFSFLLLIHFLVFPRVGFSSSESTNSFKTMTAARSSILNCRINEHAVLDETCWMNQLKCKIGFHAIGCICPGLNIHSILKHTHLENVFHHINNFHQNIKFFMEEESNAELAFFDTLLPGNNKKTLYWFIGSLGILTNTYTATQRSCKEGVVSSLLNRAYSIITNKDDLYKEITRIKQVLKENAYHTLSHITYY